MTIIAEYVWIGGNGELRSKARVLPDSNLPEWNYDGSSTSQADGNYSEVFIRPKAVFKCPFRRGDNLLVMCDTYLADGTPHPTNNRVYAESLFKKKPEEEPWYGLEQEYVLIDPTTWFPMGFHPVTGQPPKLGFQGPYYCSAGAGRAFGRSIVDAHLEACLYAGIRISGINAEVAPGQWEFQVGPCVGIEAGDHLYMARYILNRIGEEKNVAINLEPKPMVGDWNGSGCHANFSTVSMREGRDGKKGIDFINDAVEKLALHHREHMLMYGEGNEQRMTGKHETAKFDEFSWGVANRGASCRIPSATARDGQGYFEDRRPASNCDPYLVTGILFQTCVLHET